jgi:hypothetical protein
MNAPLRLIVEQRNGKGVDLVGLQVLDHSPELNTLKEITAAFAP